MEKGRQSDDILDKMRRCALAVIFTVNNDDYPYSTAGTVFLVNFKQSTFIITPKHVIKDCDIQDIVICPVWNNMYRFSYLSSWEFEVDPQDSDVSDILIIEVDSEAIPDTMRKEIEFIDLDDPGDVAWFDERNDSKFFLYGFPLDGSDIDYEDPSQVEVKTTQYFFAGEYIGVSSFSDKCHIIKVENPLNLGNFGGMNGSPVFSHRNEGEAGTPRRFCGMVLRGTSESSLFHFLGAEVIMELLDKALKHPGYLALSSGLASRNH